MITSNCPICDFKLTIPKNTEVSEIITCSDCHSRLVVAKLNATAVTLEQAPAVEEDWGE